MNQDGLSQDSLVPAALLPLLALALATVGPTAAARAQDALPSVSDYRLPSGQSIQRTRPQGPVDPDNPVVVPPRATPTESEEAPAAPATATATAAPAAPVSAATPRESQPARPAAAPAANRNASAAPAAIPVPATSPAATPAPSASASPASLPASPPATPPVAWNVHSASEMIAAQSPGLWPWLAGLAFLVGVAITLVLQQTLRRRRARLIDSEEAGWVTAEPQPAAASPVAPAMPVRSPLPAEPSPPAPAAALDLIDVLAATQVPARSPAANGRSNTLQESRPALGVLVNPLDVVLAARRMSATLMNAVLSYELIVSNRGSDAIGPVTVGGDMIGAHATLPERAQLEISGQAIVPLHRLASLAPGESVTLSGEFKLPLAAITPIRSGTAALFVPLARFRVEAARTGAPPLAVNSVFVIGEDQQRPGAALRPFRLDLGPRLYSHIGQRELALSA